VGEKQKARELAYETWRECGQNFSEAERKLRQPEIGLPVSRQTLMAWAEKYDWKGRAARAESEKESREARESAARDEDALVGALARQKERYEKYFDTLDPSKVDNQACYAFCGLVKTMIQVRRGLTFIPRGAGEMGQETGAGQAEAESELPLARVISGEADRISAIEEIVDVLLGRVLADPEKVNAGTFREIRAALAMVEQLKARHETEAPEQFEDKIPLDPPLEKGEETEAPSAVMITGPEDAKAALWEIFSRMLNAMLAHPEKIKVAEIERVEGYLEKMMRDHPRFGSLPEEQGIGAYPGPLPEGEGKAEDRGETADCEDAEAAAVLVDVGLWTEEQAIEALQEFVRRQLSAMRKEPGAAKAGQVKAVKDAMELIDELKLKTEEGKRKALEGQKKKGLPGEVAEEFRAKLLRGERE
jgi:hypothetical protein